MKKLLLLLSISINAFCYEYRDTKDFDFDQFIKLQRTVDWADDRTPEKVQKMIDNSQLIITAWDGPNLIGMARVLTDYTYRAIVHDVIVDEAYRGEGIGSEIMNQIEHHPSLQEVEFLFLYTNKPKFYERLGYLQFSEAKGMFLPMKNFKP